ncbi:ribosome modulation factor [Pseudomonas sp. EL_65y_Pfl2_R95]|uniref:ribosome modulation factor n=1 Tax=Pseudomonas sp. EL_65y_Pfl2_R95 TaxID=3088698 RepID=UPI0030D7A30B
MASDSQTEHHQDWSLENLNKAYQQGYMSGLTGQPKAPRKQTAEVLIAAWEAGWDDGHDQYELVKQESA